MVGCTHELAFLYLKNYPVGYVDVVGFQIQEGKLMSTANHLVEAEKILQRMIKKNPLLQKLIDELDLVLVDASHIASDGKNPP